MVTKTASRFHAATSNINGEKILGKFICNNSFINNTEKRIFSLIYIVNKTKFLVSPRLAGDPIED